ncbi:activity-regulated cytoskeleton associated protein 1-like [Anastrepha ludens]|uniref:activity-regulated cytoskeleton associated protein 1-like n=1 Tax=Anastrepha ludens TaxID=28586 RepID=UPI0023B0D953|nr:activity-regulated cytoskeleton associated protein 1-like [Anastrepha ludens]XP_053966980.1 activity-regulated cytoskeleton associated protein 1-like [Anastrepha ludens]
MAENVVRMTNEQLQSLIESVRLAAVEGASSAVSATIQTKGNFTNCSIRFGGQRDHEAVEQFITSIVTYKEIESISDEYALKGLSLLFYGLASTWWQGVRKEAKTWADAIALIRDHFSPTKPVYQIYLEIFENKQDDRAAIDTFICQKRALLAQLPEGRHDEETELDLVYGLLNIKYRKNILRQDIKTFRELLEKGRIIEHLNLKSKEVQTGPVRDFKLTKRCTHCNFRGHTFAECRKRRTSNDESNTVTTTHTHTQHQPMENDIIA